MKITTALGLTALAVAALSVGMRRQIFGLYAQSQFAGATLVLDVYANCDFGQPGCVATSREIDTYGPDYTRNQETLWLGEKAVADPRISSITALNGDATFIFGSVGEYSYWPKRNPARVKPVNLSGDCAEFRTPNQTRSGKSISVLGYRAVEYVTEPSDQTADANATHAVFYYLPELECASYSATYHNAAHKITMVPVQFSPTYDSAKLAMRPAGFVEKPPSETGRDSSARSLALQGYTAAQIDEVWQKDNMHGDQALADQRWRALNLEK